MPKMKMDTSHNQQMPKMSMDTSTIKQKDMKDMQNMEMLPMPFFTHMGMPLNVGSYDLKVAVLPTQNGGNTSTEFNVQFMTGLTKNLGLQLGAQGAFDSPTLEAMFQFLVWKSKNGMNAFSPIIEFEFPIAQDAEHKVYTLVGFATTFSNSHIAFNQVLHYSPLEDLAEGSASLVFKISDRVFFVSELLGVTQKGQSPIFNIIGGVKLEVNKNFMIAIGYQHPITSNKDFSSQYIFQPDMEWKK
ncbi:MAG TPA: hypothetical protein VIM07_05065 [Chitinophagaceae bacterium]